MRFKSVCSLLFFTSTLWLSVAQAQNTIPDSIDFALKSMIAEGKIVGASLSVIHGGLSQVAYYGYADKESNTPVDENTVFEIGSNSKAFTAYAVLGLLEANGIDLHTPIGEYLKVMNGVKFEGQTATITIGQLLHHTSGIAWETISDIPEGNTPGLLAKTVEIVSQAPLKNAPGSTYEYATVNYDVLGLLIETLSGMSYKAYMEERVFAPLGMNETTVGAAKDKSLLATGYKYGFYSPRTFSAPRYMGNAPAGYIVSNGVDMLKWLDFQLFGDSLSLRKSHERDPSVAPHNLLSYGGGWEIALDGSQNISHGGLNPNFSSFVAFNKAKGTAIAVLTNTNTVFTDALGMHTLQAVNGEIDPDETFEPIKQNDAMFSTITLAIGFLIVLQVYYMFWIGYRLIRKKRRFARPSRATAWKLLISCGFVGIATYSIYLLPLALVGFNWDAALIWSPFSFYYLLISFVVLLVVSLITFTMTAFTYESSTFWNKGPLLLFLSFASGVSNMMLIIYVTSSVNSDTELKYLLLYFGLIFLVYILGRKVVQTSLIRMTVNIIYDLRVRLINKIFNTSYQKFEKIENGRIYATLNDDTNTLGESANIIIGLLTSFITVIGAFAYLASIAFWATALTIGLILLITSIYYIVGSRAGRLFDKARSTANQYMSFLNGMVDGFKEISIHRKKKIGYKNDVETVIKAFRSNLAKGQIKFVNAFLVGESMLLIVLASVAFLMPLIFGAIKASDQVNFIIILLYLIGPINSILSAIPQVMQLRIAYHRIKGFTEEIPAEKNLVDRIEHNIPLTLGSFKTEGLTYHYDKREDEQSFHVGPVDIDLKAGEVLFIIGGNGSGKTTLSKVLTGLYQAHEGKITINGKEVSSQQLSEHYAVVYTQHFLFEKLYGIKTHDKEDDIKKYLDTLKMDHKVNISDEGKYSTIDLSGGQRKRLALLECFLQDKPIYMFDEWAADQDPTYRKKFYRELIPMMKEQGKIVIAITHDDHYFDMADKIIKLDQGKVEYLDLHQASYAFN